MKMKFFAFAVLLLSHFNSNAQEPWVENNAEWNYIYFTSGLDAVSKILRVRKTGNVMYNGVLCDELVTEKRENNVSQNLIATIGTTYTYKSVTGDSIMYYQNGAFRVLYDFSPNNSFWLTYTNPNTSSLSGCADTLFSERYNLTTENFGGNNNFRQMEIYLMDQDTAYVALSHFVADRIGLFGIFATNAIFPSLIPDCPLQNDELMYQFVCFNDDSVSVGNCDLLGTDELSNYGIEIYPNPVAENLTIEVKIAQGDDLQMSIYSTSGKKMIEGESISLGKNQFDIRDLDAGVYILQLSNDSGTIRRDRIVVQ